MLVVSHSIVTGPSPVLHNKTHNNDERRCDTRLLAAGIPRLMRDVHHQYSMLLHMALNSSVREKGWRSRKQGMQALCKYLRVERAGRGIRSDARAASQAFERMRTVRT